MNIKSFLQEFADASVSLLRGFTFPSAVTPPGGNSLGTIAIFAFVNGILYALVLNGFTGAGINPTHLSVVAVFAIWGLVLFFWIMSKAFLSLTDSSAELNANLVETHLTIWALISVLMLVAGLSEANPFSEISSNHGSWKAFFIIFVSALVALFANCLYWLIRWMLAKIDAKLFGEFSGGNIGFWIWLALLHFFVSTIACTLFIGLPLTQS